MNERSYVLVTAARNEEAFIGGTIDSVLSQTHLPLKWVIVSDGSSDRTDEIVAAHAARHDFIRLLRRSATKGRSFSSKIAAFRLGLDEVAPLPFDFVGNLDADVTVDPLYYARALERFAEQPRLGISSAIYWHRIDGRLRLSRTRSTDTPGAVQLFRRRCYDEIGGYRTVELGGEDVLAAATARMRGWQTLSFREPAVIHERLSGTAEGRGLVRYRFQLGAANYDWGTHPLFMIGKALRRIDEPPRLLGSAALLGGYVGRWLRRPTRDVPEDVVRFLRREQLDRLLSGLRASRGLTDPVGD